jgi:DNA segregation ATPase FtsK/SpoIIIE, S-DNA-T family
MSTRRKKSLSPRRPRSQTGSKASQPAQRTLDEWLVEAAAPWRVEIVAAAVIVVGVTTLAALAGAPFGTPGELWVRLLRQALGWGSWIAGLSLVAGGLHVILRRAGRSWSIHALQIIGFEIAFAAALALTHLGSASDEDTALYLAAGGRGGGYVGWALSAPLVEGFGALLTWLVLAAVWSTGTALLFRVSRQDVQGWFLRVSAAMQAWAERIQQQTAAPSPESGQPQKRIRAERKEETPASPQRPALVKSEPAEMVIAHAQTKMRIAPRPAHLPSLDLLEEGTPVAYSEEEVRRKAAIIESTLLDFGVPVRVLEVRRGPAVTQFGIAPLYIERSAANGQVREHKVRVNQITALASDLALALAATSIRIEAPVPGRPIVGIEVPNEKTALVYLRSVMSSEQFHRVKSPLAIGLGLDVSGTPVVANLASMPHLLIAGTTGSGKSVCINSLTTCLVCNNRPDDLKLVMIDPKMVELVRFNGLPHLLGRVEVELERIIGVLRWLTHEMDNRYKVLANAGARSLADYNKLAGRRKSSEQLPYIVLLIDELADLMMMAPEEVEQTLVRLAQMARAVGIHLVIATQRPSTDVVTGLIKANFPARIAFAVASSVDSRVILDSTGADHLLGKGDMLYQSPEAAKPARLQGCFVSDLEIERVVGFWRHEMAGADVPQREVAPWEELLARQSLIKEKDDLLQDAIALAQQNESISTSFIQRRLRIGYPRAARLMEALEEMGVVGQGQPGGRTRDVLVNEDDDPLSDYLDLEGNGD